MANTPEERKARTRVSFVVMSEATPLAFVSSLLRATPTVLHVMGEEHTTKRGTFVRPRHVWRYSLFDHDEVSTRLDEYLEQICRFLEERRQQVHKLMNRNDLTVEISVWATIDADIAKLSLESALWRRLMEYCVRVNLVIDTVCLDE